MLRSFGWLVPAILLASGAIASSRALAASAPDPPCDASVSPYTRSPANLHACGFKTYPLQRTYVVQSGPAKGATAYVYDVEGAQTVYLVPPAGFDFAVATPAQLAAYGVPPEPPASAPEARARWLEMVNNMRFSTPPRAIISVPGVLAGPSTNMPDRTMIARHKRSDGCPRHGGRPANHWRATRRHVLPRGARRVRLCRYAATGRGGRLRLQAASVVKHRRTIRKLTRRMSRLPRPPKGPTACGLNNGSRVLVLARYRHHRRAAVTIDLSGCETVSNGHLTRRALAPNGPGPRLIHQVKRLTRRGHHRS